MKDKIAIFTVFFSLIIVLGLTSTIHSLNFPSTDIRNVAANSPLEDDTIPNGCLRVKGYVNDINDNPLRRAEVTVKSSSGQLLGSYIAGTDGYYEITFRKVFTSYYRVTATAPGYIDDSVTISGSCIINFNLISYFDQYDIYP